VTSVLVSLNQINLAWSASAGAGSYVVDRGLDGQTWSAIATGVSSTSFSDPGLNFATTYYYRVVAVSSAGDSAPSAIVSARTGAQPDVLSMAPLLIHATRRLPYNGPVALLFDANTSTPAGRLIAAINWGDGVVTTGIVSGGGGCFIVSGAHIYNATGTFVVEVSVTMFGAEFTSATTSSAADVIPRSRRGVHPRPRGSHRALRLPHPADARRGDWPISR
jgi:cellulose 1,4-beta-cellobiosidase